MTKTEQAFGKKKGFAGQSTFAGKEALLLRNQKFEPNVSPGQRKKYAGGIVANYVRKHGGK